MLNKYNCISSSEIQTKASNMCRQQQDVYRWITVEPSIHCGKKTGNIPATTTLVNRRFISSVAIKASKLVLVKTSNEWQIWLILVH